MQRAHHKQPGNLCFSDHSTLSPRLCPRFKRHTRRTLEELKLPYEAVNLDMRAGEHKRPEYLKVHPFGKVPALQDGDVSLFESGAICLYLFNKYGKLSPDALGSAAQVGWAQRSVVCDAVLVWRTVVVSMQSAAQRMLLCALMGCF